MNKEQNNMINGITRGLIRPNPDIQSMINKYIDAVNDGRKIKVATFSKGQFKLVALINGNGRTNILRYNNTGEMERGMCAYIKKTDSEYLNEFSSDNRNVQQFISELKEYDMTAEYISCIQQLVKFIYGNDIQIRSDINRNDSVEHLSDMFSDLKFDRSIFSEGYKKFDPDFCEKIRLQSIVKENIIIGQTFLNNGWKLITFTDKLVLKDNDNIITTIPYMIEGTPQAFVAVTLINWLNNSTGEILKILNPAKLQIGMDSACRYFYGKSFALLGVIKNFIQNKHRICAEDFQIVKQNTFKLSELDVNKIVDLIYEKIKADNLTSTVSDTGARKMSMFS